MGRRNFLFTGGAWTFEFTKADIYLAKMKLSQCLPAVFVALTLLRVTWAAYFLNPMDYASFANNNECIETGCSAFCAEEGNRAVGFDTDGEGVVDEADCAAMCDTGCDDEHLCGKPDLGVDDCIKEHVQDACWNQCGPILYPKDTDDWVAVKK